MDDQRRTFLTSLLPSLRRDSTRSSFGGVGVGSTGGSGIGFRSLNGFRSPNGFRFPNGFRAPKGLRSPADFRSPNGFGSPNGFRSPDHGRRSPDGLRSPNGFRSPNCLRSPTGLRPLWDRVFPNGFGFPKAGGFVYGFGFGVHARRCSVFLCSVRPRSVLVGPVLRAPCSVVRRSSCRRSRRCPSNRGLSFFGLNRSRGSRWDPPGRQSRPRASVGGGDATARRASSGDSQSRPRAKYFIVTPGCFCRRRSNVGTRSARSCARNGVGASPIRIVQYAWRGGIRRTRPGASVFPPASSVSS